MNNFFADNDDLFFHLDHPGLDRIVQLLEDGFGLKQAKPPAPAIIEQARAQRRDALQKAGRIAAKELAPFAAEADAQGARFRDGVVTAPASHARATALLGKTGLLGLTLPRAYGGRGMPGTVAAMMMEVLARADASFLGPMLGICAAGVIERFASEDVKAAYLPRLASGAASCAMVLTEAEAGSDLGAAALKAREDADGSWRLSGAKRFITNGDADVLLVLARSEENMPGAKGLSLFLCEAGDRVIVEGVEDKMGIRASPTCTLSFDEAPARLVGRRKRGLSTYAMRLMHAGRLGAAGQALGVAEAAYREADAFARGRVQFGRPIREMAQVAEMLVRMRTGIEAARSLYYEAQRIADLRDALERVLAVSPERAPELGEELARCELELELLVPMTKACATEMANRVAYDAVQIWGGRGYLKGSSVERLYRDARVSTIYEGTTQLQIAASVRGVMSGTALAYIERLEGEGAFAADALLDAVKKARDDFAQAVSVVRAKDDSLYGEYHARRLVEIATDIVRAELLLHDAGRSERKVAVAEAFIEQTLPCVRSHLNAIARDMRSTRRRWSTIIGEERVTDLPSPILRILVMILTHVIAFSMR